MQLKGLDFVMEDIVQSTNGVCVTGQRCPISSSFGESTYRLIERFITWKLPIRNRVSRAAEGRRRAREGTANSGIVIGNRDMVAQKT
jgi:hypothetical protein